MRESEVKAELRDASRELRDAIIAALWQFSNRTGMLVHGAAWQTCETWDANGDREDIQYYDVRASVSVGGA